MVATIVILIALAVFALLVMREAWVGYPPPRFAARILTRKEQAFLRACADVLFPQGGALPSAEEAGVVRNLDRMLFELPKRQRLLIRCLFLLVEHGSLLFGPVRSRVTRQTEEERVSTFERWEGSPIYLRRVSFLSLRTLLTLAYFGNPAVVRAVSSAEAS